MAGRTRDIAGYRDAELIGQGGFAAVYKAADAAHGREVAIKVREGALGDTERRRFDRERQTMGRLGSHPNIIPVYESGYTESGEGYIVMQLATGGSLGARLRSAGPLPWPEAVEIMAAVAGAAQAAHDSGVLHRDIKPDNILIDQYGNPKLSDFGIAAVANNATATMSTTATLAHAAPELLQGQQIGPGVDIYALGSTLFNLITGLPPFIRPDDEGVTPMITRALTEAPPDLRPQGVPDPVARIIEQSLAKDPAQRQPTAHAMAAQLKAAATGAPLPNSATVAVPNPPPLIAQTPTGSPAWPPTGPQAPEGPRPTQPQYATVPPHGFQNTRPGFPNTPAGFPSGPQGFPVPPQGYQTGPMSPANDIGPAPFHPSGPPASSGGGTGKILALVGAGLVALLALGGIAAAVANSGDDTTTTTPSTTAASTTLLGATTTVGTGNSTATVSIECPEQIQLNTKIYCTITTVGAASGTWDLPGFKDAPEPFDSSTGTFDIFINPTNSSAVGQTFTITATVTDAAGASTSAQKSFTVTGISVSITCPAEIALNETVYCDIVTANATSGEWSIPQFGQGALDVVPGISSIQIQPSAPEAVGQTFTLTATASDASGQTASAIHSFTVTAG
ncbi:MAG: protein kinase [Acidimicrobiia bacterium]|nr:protein kinase [Acidimicrobiia bacterium]